METGLITREFSHPFMENPYKHLSVEQKASHFKELNAYKDEMRQHPELRSLFIEMTLNCNEHCLHCGSRAGGQHTDRPLSDEEILLTLKHLKRDLVRYRQPMPFINITGGEPMLRPHLVELMKEIHEMGYNWGMTSNGLLITEEKAAALKEAGMYSVSISVDGMEENHDWFRQHKGGWKLAVEAVDHLIAAGIPSVMITTVVNQRNKNELNQVYQLVKKHKCNLWRIINIDPIGRTLDHPDLLLNPEDYQNMIQFILAHQNDRYMNVIYTCNYYLGLEREGKIRPWYYFCRAGLQLASIQYNGDISACLDIERRPELIFGNVRKDNLMQVWRKGFGIYREHKEEKSTKCRSCKHRENCQGSGWHTWDFEKNEPRICMMEELGESL